MKKKKPTVKKRTTVVKNSHHPLSGKKKGRAIRNRTSSANDSSGENLYWTKKTHVNQICGKEGRCSVFPPSSRKG